MKRGLVVKKRAAFLNARARQPTNAMKASLISFSFASSKVDSKRNLQPQSNLMVFFSSSVTLFSYKWEL